MPKLTNQQLKSIIYLIHREIHREDNQLLTTPYTRDDLLKLQQQVTILLYDKEA